MLSPLATPGRFGDLPRHLSVSPSKKRASMSPTKRKATSILDFTPTKRRRIEEPDSPASSSSQPEIKTKPPPFHDFPAFLVVALYPLLSLADRISAIHVSHNWRHAFRSSPLVWQDLSIGISSRANPDLAWLLRLSKELEICLNMDVRSRTSLVHWLPEGLRRVRELTISALLRLPAPCELCLTRGGWTTLESLSLVVPRPHNNPYVMPLNLFQGGAPLLQDVRLENVHFPEGSGSTIAAFANVQVLSYTRGDSMSAHSLSCLFEHFPSLRCLSLSAKLSANGPARVSSLSPVLSSVTLLRPSSRLVSLFLDRTTFPVLDDIDVPGCSMELLNNLPARELHFRRSGLMILCFSAGQKLRVTQMKSAPHIVLGAKLLSSLRNLSLPSCLVSEIHVEQLDDPVPRQPDYSLLLRVHAQRGTVDSPTPATEALVDAIERIGRTVILDIA